MKISKAREWVDNTYQEEELEKLKKPIYRKKYLDDLDGFLVDRKQNSLNTLIQDLTSLLEEYPDAMVYKEINYDGLELSISTQELVRYETQGEVRDRLAKDYQREQNSLERAEARAKKAKEKATQAEEREKELLKKLKEKYE